MHSLESFLSINIWISLSYGWTLDFESKNEVKLPWSWLKIKLNNSQIHEKTKYLIVGGNIHMTEVVDLENSNSTSNFYGTLPLTRMGNGFLHTGNGNVGAMLGGAPIICGGKDGQGDCLTFNNSHWISSHSLYSQKRREYMAGVLINSTTLWLTGGSAYGINRVSSTEFIVSGKKVGILGPKLPYGLKGHCAVKLSDNAVFVIGGEAGHQLRVRNEVWIYNPQNGFTRRQGPSLITPRWGHSCASIRNGNKSLIIVAGGIDKFSPLDSIEIYDPIEKFWYYGPKMPHELVYGAMAASPDHKGILVFGGINYNCCWLKLGPYRKKNCDSGYATNTILELKIGATSWTFVDNTLQSKRHNHAVIPIQ